MYEKPGPKSKKLKYSKTISNYEVSYISKDNKIRISKNCIINNQIRLEQIKRFKQLNNYKIDFIHYFNDDDDNFIAYLCNESIYYLAIRIFKRYNKIKKSIEYKQCLNYEIYQKRDGFYLTILTFVNTELKNEQIVPLFYLIHEKNDLNTHLNFWKNFIAKKLSSFRLPITFNIKDQTIKEAILEYFNTHLDSKLFFCSNNIYYNIKNYIKINNLNLIDCSENFISATKINEFMIIYDESKVIWPTEYLTFFDNEIKPLILSNLKRNKSSNFNPKSINFKPINFSIKFLESKDNCLTDLIWKLYKNSCKLIIKFNREYTDELKIMSKYIEYINQENHKNTFSHFDFFDPSIYQLFHFEFADLIVRNNLIYEKDEMFIISSPFNDSIETVTTVDQNGLTDCTCTLKKFLTPLCAHKIAAKIFFENNNQ